MCVYIYEDSDNGTRPRSKSLQKVKIRRAYGPGRVRSRVWAVGFSGSLLYTGSSGSCSLVLYFPPTPQRASGAQMCEDQWVA